MGALSLRLLSLSVVLCCVMKPAWAQENCPLWGELEEEVSELASRRLGIPLDAARRLLSSSEDALEVIELVKIRNWLNAPHTEFYQNLERRLKAGEALPTAVESALKETNSQVPLSFPPRLVEAIETAQATESGMPVRKASYWKAALRALPNDARSKLKSDSYESIPRELEELYSRIPSPDISEKDIQELLRRYRQSNYNAGREHQNVLLRLLHEQLEKDRAAGGPKVSELLRKGIEMRGKALAEDFSLTREEENTWATVPTDPKELADYIVQHSLTKSSGRNMSEALSKLPEEARTSALTIMQQVKRALEMNPDAKGFPFGTDAVTKLASSQDLYEIRPLRGSTTFRILFAINRGRVYYLYGGDVKAGGGAKQSVKIAEAESRWRSYLMSP